MTPSPHTEPASKMLATAVAQATESVVITDAQGHIQYVNPSFEKNTGYTRSEAVGRTPAILKSGAHDDAFYREIWETITSGDPWAGQIRNKRKDGSFYIEDCIITPVFSESGDIINFVGVKHDITRTLELEEQTRQSQRIESLGRLAGGVAHDINNMLFPILGHTDLLLQDLPKSSLYREPIEEVHKAAEKIRDLVRQLLAFGRKQTLEMGPADLNHIISNFEKLLRKTIREDVSMEIVRDPDLPLVMADIGQVEQIIMNLVVNAHLAMPNGGRLRIETGTGQMPGMPGRARGGPEGKPAGKQPTDCAFIRITDNGQGMDDRTRSRIFEPFFTTRPEGQGTGLGLSTVYGIVKQHQGQIRVQSEPGKGSCFTVSLPVCEMENCPGTCDLCHPKPANKKEPVQDTARTVMVAEDNPMAMGIARTALERLGYEVVMAGDGKACKAFLSGYGGALDLLLSDVVMADVNGRDLHRHVVQQFPEVKTLFMSGYSHDVISHYGKGAEGLDFLAKPFSAQQLSEKLTALFRPGNRT